MRISEHALKRMRQRGISEEDVRRAIQAKPGVHLGNGLRRVLLFGLMVIVDPGRDTVVTAYHWRGQARTRLGDKLKEAMRA